MSRKRTALRRLGLIGIALAFLPCFLLAAAGLMMMMPVIGVAWIAGLDPDEDWLAYCPLIWPAFALADKWRYWTHEHHWFMFGFESTDKNLWVDERCAIYGCMRRREATPGEAYKYARLQTQAIPFNSVRNITTDGQPVPEEESDGSVIRGWRTYSLSNDGKLLGRTGVIWPEPSMQAECWGNAMNAHIHLSMGDCACGIYMFKKRPDTLHGPPYPILAECVGWGEVAEHGDEGWRCEFVRIERFIIPALTTLNSYGVPVEAE